MYDEIRYEFEDVVQITTTFRRIGLRLEAIAVKNSEMRMNSDPVVSEVI